jgi:hypothetical protein
MSQDFEASIVADVAEFTVPLLLSFSATCTAAPDCKPWRALVIISKTSEFIELSSGQSHVAAC